MKLLITCIILLSPLIAFCQSPETEDSCVVLVPDSFTPNGDQIHDGLVVESSCTISNFELKILNRWGNLVFETNDIQEYWDGNDLAMGTYYWVLTGYFPSEIAINQSGYVTLIR